MSTNEMNAMLATVGSMFWGWPLIIFVLGSGLVMTIACRGVQFRYFTAAWRYVFYPEAAGREFISPLQAFLNTLSASIGNGSLTGMATAIYSGGPGAAFWVFVLGFFTMPIRFAEVFAEQALLFVIEMALCVAGLWPIFNAHQATVLVYVYTIFCLLLTLVGGNAMQCNAVTKGLTSMMPLNIYIIAGMLFAFIVYVMIGGASRVLRVSDAVVPIKVGLFFISIVIALAFHYASLLPALNLCFNLLSLLNLLAEES